MRKDFCDRCGEYIEHVTMGNRIALLDNKLSDFCDHCASSLRRLVLKWKREPRTFAE